MEKRSDSDRWAIIGGAMHAEESLLQLPIAETHLPILHPYLGVTGITLA